MLIPCQIVSAWLNCLRLAPVCVGHRVHRGMLAVICRRAETNASMTVCSHISHACWDEAW